MTTELAVINRTADDLVQQVRLIQEVMGKLMKNGEHYGKIPGCGPKPTLLQPGAQKLCLTFRLVPKYDIQTVMMEKGHREYQVTCTLTHQPTGMFAGQGVGACCTMEKKFAEKRDGTIKEPQENYNTCTKMACKRAYVAATLAATAASDIFTQDIEDFSQSQLAPDSKMKEDEFKRRFDAGENLKSSGFDLSKGAVEEPIQVLEGELKEVWESKDWTCGVVTGIQFSTKKEDLAKAMSDAQGHIVRVRVKKMVVEGGKIKFRPQSIEVLHTSPTESETEPEPNGEEPND